MKGTGAIPPENITNPQRWGEEWKGTTKGQKAVNETAPVRPYLPVIFLNVNGSTSSTNMQRVAELQTKTQLDATHERLASPLRTHVSSK